MEPREVSGAVMRIRLFEPLVPHLAGWTLTGALVAALAVTVVAVVRGSRTEGPRTFFDGGGRVAFGRALILLTLALELGFVISFLAAPEGGPSLPDDRERLDLLRFGTLWPALLGGLWFVPWGERAAGRSSRAWVLADTAALAALAVLGGWSWTAWASSWGAEVAPDLAALTLLDWVRVLPWVLVPVLLLPGLSARGFAAGLRELVRDDRARVARAVVAGAALRAGQRAVAVMADFQTMEAETGLSGARMQHAFERVDRYLAELVATLLVAVVVLAVLCLARFRGSAAASAPRP